MEIGGNRRLVCPKAKRTNAVNGGEALDKKLKRIMEQNAADDAEDELGITEDGE